MSCVSFHGGPHSGLSKALTSNEQGEMKGPNVWTKIAWQPSIVVVFISLCGSLLSSGIIFVLLSQIWRFVILLQNVQKMKC